MGLDIAIIVFLMGLAIVLILVEIFLFPGITLAGIGGLLFALGGAIYAYSIGATMGHVTLAVSTVLFCGLFLWLLRTKSFNKVALNTEIDSKLTSSRDLGIRPGDEGITLSRLAPIGKASIKGITVEAKSREEFIDEQTPIVVIRIDSNNVIVVPKTITINNLIHS
jgi:membrane-bound ClpP family serine protease